MLLSANLVVKLASSACGHVLAVLERIDVSKHLAFTEIMTLYIFRDSDIL